MLGIWEQAKQIFNHWATLQAPVFSFVLTNYTAWSLGDFFLKMEDRDADHWRWCDSLAQFT